MTRKAKDPGQWWTEAWSPVTGCSPAGEGCRFCWARAMIRRFEALHMRLDPVDECYRVVEDFSTVVCHPDRLDKPLHWRKPRVVLVSMLGDLFHEQVPEVFIDEVALRMRMAANHVYCILTKRPQRAARYVADVWPHRFSSRSYLMASAWDQPSTDAARAAFSSLPKGVRWGLHVEPMLGPVSIMSPSWHPYPSWVVCGGENGPCARPMDPRWALDLREQCASAGVPFWFKGWGSAMRKLVESAMGPTLSGLEQTREVPW